MAIDFERIADEFPVRRVLTERYHVTVRGSEYYCPIHGETHGKANGSLFIGKDGREKWRCHKCDKSGDSLDLVREMEGLGPRDAAEALFGGTLPITRDTPRSPPKASKPQLVIDADLTPIPSAELLKIAVGKATPEVLTRKGSRRSWMPSHVHVYRDAAGVPVCIQTRITKGDGEKTFVPLTLSEKHGWVSCNYNPMPLYGAHRLANHPKKPVLVVEGEKCVDLLRTHTEFDDYVVITWANGAKAARRQDWGALKGRDVVLWPDADEPGVEAMRFIAAKVDRCRMVVPMEEWPAKTDAFDLITQGMSPHDARALMERLAVEPGGIEPAPPPSGIPSHLWVTDAEGGILPREDANLVTFITESYKGRFAWDEFTKETLVNGEPFLDETLDAERMTREIALTSPLRSIRASRVAEIIGKAARSHPINRLAEELHALKWDGEWRDLLDYAGVMSTKWSRIAGWRWFVGMVKRILYPGTKHDGVLILKGRQGVGKTRFFETVGTVLGRDLYAELSKLTMDPDVQMKLAGKCVIELSEMQAHRVGETDSLKAMLTSRTDLYRRPYARGHESVPRTCVFGGTTNEHQFLRDRTGNRRYWVVPVTESIDIPGLEATMSQLLAQAVHHISQGGRGAQNWLDPDEERLQEVEALQYQLDLPMEDRLDAALHDLTSTTVPLFSTTLEEKLGYRPEYWNNERHKELRELMEKRGYRKGKYNRASGDSRSLWRLIT